MRKTFFDQPQLDEDEVPLGGELKKGKGRFISPNDILLSAKTFIKVLKEELQKNKQPS